MNDIIVVTYCTWKSYGSILQAYALQVFLDSLGAHSEIHILGQRPQPTDACKIIWKLSETTQNIKSILNKKAIRNRLYKNSKFIDDRIRIQYHQSMESLKKATNQARLFIAGSDQIFHPALCSKVFFLDFVDRQIPKVAYAASMGQTFIPAEKQKEFRRLINNFDLLSFREYDAANIAESYTQKGIEVHIDPTFLMKAEKWRSLQAFYPTPQKYILVYPIYWDTRYDNQIKALHNRTGLPVIVITDSFRIYHQKLVRDVGVCQFLWLLDHASYVISSSFHGAAFAINFHKKLSMIINPNLPSRLRTLSTITGYPVISIRDIDQNMEIQWNAVDQSINQECTRSRNYLLKALKFSTEKE